MFPYRATLSLSTIFDAPRSFFLVRHFLGITTMTPVRRRRHTKNNTDNFSKEEWYCQNEMELKFQGKKIHVGDLAEKAKKNPKEDCRHGCPKPVHDEAVMLETVVYRQSLVLVLSLHFACVVIIITVVCLLIKHLDLFAPAQKKKKTKRKKNLYVYITYMAYAAAL